MIAFECTKGVPEIFAPKTLRMNNRQGLKNFGVHLQREDQANIQINKINGTQIGQGLWYGLF